MARTSLRRIRTFIEMYDMQDTLAVKPLDQSQSKYQVSHMVGKGNHGDDPDYNVYICRNQRAAAECVNEIIFDIDMGDRAIPA